MRWWLITACALIALASFVVPQAISVDAQTNPEEPSVDCTESNANFARTALAHIFGDKLDPAGMTDLLCLKSAFSSDLFVLGQLEPSVDLSHFTLQAPDDWQKARLAAAFDGFPDRFPDPKTSEVQVTSGFSDGGQKIVVIADFDEKGRFVYFEL